MYQAAAAGTIWQPLPRAARLAAARVPQPDLWTSDRLAEWLAGDPARARAQLLVRLEPHASGDWLEQERLFRWRTTGRTTVNRHARHRRDTIAG